MNGRHCVQAYLLASALILALAPAPAPAHAAAQSGSEPSKVTRQESSAERDGQHDFNFEFGSWTAHLKRLLHPLSGSDTWVNYEGPSIVRKVWDGRANLGEIELDGPSGHIQALSLRLYDPQTRQWSIFFANSRDGSLGKPMIGGFKNGRGEFFDQEDLNGKAIFVRFIFSDITPRSFRFEQAFSADGGKTWEPNWVATFTRDKQ